MIAVVGMVIYGQVKVVEGHRSNGEEMKDALNCCLRADMKQDDMLYDPLSADDAEVVPSPADDSGAVPSTVIALHRQNLSTPFAQHA